ncbi:N-6 DNA methylase [Azospirillum sp. sgz302134]
MNDETGTLRETIQGLWSLCNVLRDDGVTSQEYVTELSYILFLKMMRETGREALLPEGYRWNDLRATGGDNTLVFYRNMLKLFAESPNSLVRSIFSESRTSLRHDANLQKIIAAIDGIEWFSQQAERIGDMYEGLLERVATDRKSGAGQYFTPRPLVECLIEVIKPTAGEVVQDPAAGTGGFLVATDRYLKQRAVHVDESAHRALLCGMELVPETYRLLLMNLVLHNIAPDGVLLGDTLAKSGQSLARADIVLTNPPFGSGKGGRKPTRADFTITADTSNKQLCFVEHVVRTLKPGGRAAVIVPDNVLFANGQARDLRSWLMEECNLHTILRLPSGIFYAQGIKTSVLFFTRATKPGNATKKVWVYDLRAGQPAYGRNRPLRATDFEEFIALFGADPCGRTSRANVKSTEDRFRCFTRKEIALGGDNLDLTWLSALDASEEALEDPQDLIEAMRGHLQRAFAGIDALSTLIDSACSE